MANKDSAKKVAKAARAGSGSVAGAKREVAFPLAIVAVILLGVALVVYARDARDATAAPRLSDHWHDAYGVYDCSTEGFLPTFALTTDPLGIHSHDDGLIHIHPFSSQAAGENAKVGVFLDAVGVQMSEDALVLPDGTTLAAGTDCGGEPAIIQIWRWDLDADLEPQVITGDFNDVRFRKDREAYTFALAPEGFEPVQPPTVAGVDSASDVIDPEGDSTTTTIAGETTTAVTDGDTTTTVESADETTTTAAAEETTTTAEG